MKLILIQSKNIMQNFLIINEFAKHKDLSETIVIFDGKCSSETNQLIKLFPELYITKLKINNYFNVEEIKNKISKYNKEKLHLDLTSGYKFTTILLYAISKIINQEVSFSYLDIHKKKLIFLKLNSNNNLEEVNSKMVYKILEENKLKLKELILVQLKQEYSYVKFKTIFEVKEDYKLDIFKIVEKKFKKVLYKFWDLNKKKQMNLKERKYNKIAIKNELDKLNVYESTIREYFEGDHNKNLKLFKFLTDELLEFKLIMDFEKLTETLSIDINNEAIFNYELYKSYEKKVKGKPEFELDMIINDKGNIFVVSITLGKKSEWWVYHIYEVIHRAKQIVGESAIPVIVSSSHDINIIRKLTNNNNGFQETIYPINIDNFSNQFKQLILNKRKECDLL